MKHGLLITILSIALALVSFLLASGWNPEVGVIPNILHVTRLQLFETESRYEYYIDIPIKFVLAFFLTTATGGLLIHFNLLGNGKKPDSTA